VTNVQQIYDDGLCMQCGTCAALCPARAIDLAWDVRIGYRLTVDERKCTDCGTCREVCPGPGLDFTAGAWWRARNEGAPTRDYLGPWRRLWFGWAADPAVRHAGASGGVATALLTGVLEEGLVDTVIAVGTDPANPMEAVGVVCRTAAEVAACRGSKYNVVALNTQLRRVLDEPGRYAVVGLPCHVQGLRLAQRRSPRLRERVVLSLGIFCGLTNEPRATEIFARRAGLDPAALSAVSYRGPGWPGGLRLETRDGRVRCRDFPDYFDRYCWAHQPPRCRICPDSLAELADIAVGDAWLDRFEGSDGVSDIVVRTPAGETVMAVLADRLALVEATPDDVVFSQRETYHMEREIGLGRLWLRSLAGRPLPRYPGLPTSVTPRQRLLGLKNAVEERLFRSLADWRFPTERGVG
jgi:coenzyme F420 hydrogenase subunit beta